jgi:hypothetical protein
LDNMRNKVTKMSDFLLVNINNGINGRNTEFVFAYGDKGVLSVVALGTPFLMST